MGVASSPEVNRRRLVTTGAFVGAAAATVAMGRSIVRRRRARRQQILCEEMAPEAVAAAHRAKVARIAAQLRAHDAIAGPSRCARRRRRTRCPKAATCAGATTRSTSAISTAILVDRSGRAHCASPRVGRDVRRPRRRDAAPRPRADRRARAQDDHDRRRGRAAARSSRCRSLRRLPRHLPRVRGDHRDRRRAALHAPTTSTRSCSR